jgi:hypothetical protein
MMALSARSYSAGKLLSPGADGGTAGSGRILLAAPDRTRRERPGDGGQRRARSRPDERPGASSVQPAPASPEAKAAAQARAIRILLVALLTALAAAVLRGHIRLHSHAGPARGDGIAVGAILEAVLTILLIALLIRGRRAPPGAALAARLRNVLRLLLTAGLVANPVVLLLAAPLRTHPRPLPAPTPPEPTAPTPGAGGIPIPLAAVLYTLLVIALIAAPVVCAVALRRRQTAVSYPEAAPDADAQRHWAAGGRRVRPKRAAGVRRRPGRHHCLLPVHGAEPGQRGNGTGRSRHPG